MPVNLSTTIKNLKILDNDSNSKLILNYSYLKSKIWDLDELQSIIKYEQYKRNKTGLTLIWDLDTRPQEIAFLKIKHLRLREKYDECEIPFESKTKTRPFLLTFSFSYVRDWLDEHPFKNDIMQV